VLYSTLKAPAQIVNWFIKQHRLIARALAWLGILAITLLSVVPTVDRPVTGAGQWWEHFTAFALVAGFFAIGYRLSLTRLLLWAFSFCGGIELFQVPLPTRHARVSDLVVDIIGSCFGIGLVFSIEKLLGVQRGRGDLMVRPREPSSSQSGQAH
jgi:VanZ family protein